MSVRPLANNCKPLHLVTQIFPFLNLDYTFLRMPASNGVKHCAIVAAVTEEGGLGMEGRLPWHPRRLTLDLAFLQFITTNDYRILREPKPAIEFIKNEDGAYINSVVMGRKTWESLPPRFRPLKGRRNYVITRDSAFSPEGAQVLTSPLNLLQSCGNTNNHVYILGGTGVYQEGLESGQVECAFITEIFDHPEMPCDVKFPVGLLPTKFKNRVNVTKLAVDQLKASLKIDEGHRLAEDESDPFFIDGDLSYRIFAYF